MSKTIDELRNETLDQTLNIINSELYHQDLPFRFKNQHDCTISLAITDIPMKAKESNQPKLINFMICYLLAPLDVTPDAFRRYLVLNCSDTILRSFDAMINQFSLVAHNQKDEVLHEFIMNHSEQTHAKLASWLQQLTKEA